MTAAAGMAYFPGEEGLRLLPSGTGDTAYDRFNRPGLLRAFTALARKGSEQAAPQGSSITMGRLGLIL